MLDGYIGSGELDWESPPRDGENVKVCLSVLFNRLPEAARPKAGVSLLNVMEAEFLQSGLPVPEWLPRLRAELWN